jgi:glycosyltransferase involved in cell wall biosynthesis
MISIDGRFTVRNIGGMERYAYETLKELDKICKPNQFELVVPIYAKAIPQFQNIKVCFVKGPHNPILWEQFSFPKELRRKRSKGLYLMDTWPIFRPDFPTIHDVSMLAFPSIYKKSLYGLCSTLFHRALYKSAAKRAKKIFTVSNFSKSEIIRFLNVNDTKIVVGYCGWNHFDNVTPDYSILKKIPFISQQDFYLSLSSRTPQKNFNWINLNAKQHPNDLYLIVGDKVKLTDKIESSSENVKFVGRLSDAEIKALMKKCRAFIYPSIYEGFGLPPLEALSSGAHVIVSNSASLPEIYGICCGYLNPTDPNVDLNTLIINPSPSDVSALLQKYQWKNNAITIYNTLIPFLTE